jgi:hypothetical protein
MSTSGRARQWPFSCSSCLKDSRDLAWRPPGKGRGALRQGAAGGRGAPPAPHASSKHVRRGCLRGCRAVPPPAQEAAAAAAPGGAASASPLPRVNSPGGPRRPRLRRRAPASVVHQEPAAHDAGVLPPRLKGRRRRVVAHLISAAGLNATQLWDEGPGPHSFPLYSTPLHSAPLHSTPLLGCPILPHPPALTMVPSRSDTRHTGVPSTAASLPPRSVYVPADATS